MKPPGAAPIRRPRCPSAAVAILLGWIVPGFGQLYVGRPGKAAWFFLWVVGAFALGLYLTGFAGVHREREGLWLLAQALCGGPTAAALPWTQDIVPLTRLASYDVGLLYTGVAGLLNAIVISDALGTVEERCREAASFDRIEAARVAHAEAQLRAAEAEAEALRSLQLSPLAVASTLEGAFGGAAGPGVDGTAGLPPPPPTSTSPSLPVAAPPPRPNGPIESMEGPR